MENTVNNYYKNVTTGELFFHHWQVVPCSPSLRLNEQLWRNELKITVRDFQNEKDFRVAVDHLLKPCVKLSEKAYIRDVKRYKEACKRINNTVIAKALGGVENEKQK